ncbi:hypothetical protein IU436_26885 [Nocardia farcinica]|uniref:hypothetical protein n=1 Tax=Nocardia farcinica TaxID=37329 RepID=UPI0018945DF7|nr:hypothetical protein [Nocardia farcinica]MBF6072575.1 hypothetical protein [Nocardia farcinica]MBF6259406.1 hypothetical protein [Nocardia farcinica]MBF6376125.1 hypothetical protein [Nocardia farcinica]MBF6422308.1 hypothetical protein [Nocardia farcinica]MBF6433972.1 hypothetical protein [Nocardia farcinica]
MFEQRDRWLEELDEYTGRKETITCTAGRMPLTAIVDEISNACDDKADPALDPFRTCSVSHATELLALR